MIEVCITYKTITPESAELGDIAESGIESESELLTFRELVGQLRYRFTVYSESPGPYSPYTWARKIAEGYGLQAVIQGDPRGPVLSLAPKDASRDDIDSGRIRGLYVR